MSRNLILLAWLLAAPVLTRGADPEPAAVRGSTPEFARLVRQLDAEQFVVREEAVQQLLELGPAAIPDLEQAAEQDNPGLSRQALAVLERLFVDGCLSTADDAEFALERLTSSTRPATSRRAAIILAGHQRLREQRAVAAIRELGGKVEYIEVDPGQLAMLQWAPLGMIDNQVNIPGYPFAKIRITLLRDWRGGEEGLRHVARLEYNWGAYLPGCGIDLTTVRGNGLSMESVQKLAARLPGLRINERGASLGIQCLAGEKCMISDVVANGAAARAGVLPGDTIVGFDGAIITSFADLVGKLLDHVPDDQIELQIVRQGELVELPVTLGGWDDVHTGTDKPPSLKTVPPPEPAVDSFVPPEFGPER